MKMSFLEESDLTPVYLSGITQPTQLSFLINKMIQTQKSPADYLIIFPTEKQMLNFVDDVGFFTRNLNVKIFEYPSFEGRTIFDSADRCYCLCSLITESSENRIVITTTDAIQKKCIDRDILAQSNFELRIGENLDKYDFLTKLAYWGYQNVTLVEDTGSFSSRGEIIDVFLPGKEYPVRLELFDDQVEDIRTFSPESQKSITKLSSIKIIPCREFIFDGTEESKILELKDYMDKEEIDPNLQYSIVTDFKNQTFFNGIDDFIAFFYKTNSIFDYLSKNRRIIFWDQLSFSEKVIEYKNRYQDFPSNQLIPYLPEFEKSHFSHQDLMSMISKEKCCWTGGINLTEESDKVGKTIPYSFKPAVSLIKTLDRNILGKNKQDLSEVAKNIKKLTQDGYQINFVARLKSQAERLKELFKLHDIHIKEEGTYRLVTGKLSDGFIAPDFQVLYVTEEDIFGKRAKKPKDPKKKLSFSDFSELKEDDIVVHLHHGKGIYKGLYRLNFSGEDNDYLLIEYLGGDKIYVPVYRLSILQKFIGGEGRTITVDKLGGKAWETAKKKAKKAIEDISDKLLQIQAVRSLCKREPYSPIDEMYQEFEAAFPYEETEDQQEAINNVMLDLDLDKPMDRLICGDVGYGKTEVAVRAACRVALDGKQIAVLVPTTVLCFQHYHTFKSRLKKMDLKVAMLNRFVSRKDQKKILEDVKKGKVDIIIGTHRLLSKDIGFKNLGLLVVDEEQRFGVVHKERLKQLQAGVDLMTLSATPIPRTLHLAMLGIRDLSIIATPPVDRMAVRVYVAKLQDDIIKKAILSELKRGGQVYFVHNRVENIARISEYIQNLVPEGRVRYGHGQMTEHSLEKLFIDFIEHKFDVLVCTTIIESGLDIPNVNTIIIDRADTFGLAQLYQLKGRVGRSNRRAHAWLLIPGKEPVQNIAKQRLEAIQTYSELGSGFSIASYDMDIRGVGNILGSEQSGTIADIGFELYTELLNEAIQKRKGEKIIQSIDPEIDLGIKAFIPEAFISNQNLRLKYYKQISQLESEEEMDEMVSSLADCFGNLPREVENLIDIIRIKIILKKLRVVSLKRGKGLFELRFHPDVAPKVEKILTVINQYPRRFKLFPDYRVLINYRAIEENPIIFLQRNLELFADVY